MLSSPWFEPWESSWMKSLFLHNISVIYTAAATISFSNCNYVRSFSLFPSEAASTLVHAFLVFCIYYCGARYEGLESCLLDFTSEQSLLSGLVDRIPKFGRVSKYSPLARRGLGHFTPGHFAPDFPPREKCK